MKYDDAGWHYGGTFPDDLPPEAGATHIGMFVAWALLHGLGGEEHTTTYGDLNQHLVNRTMTPGEWFVQVCDEKFVDEDLNDTGNAFTQSYYSSPSDRDPPYIQDYGTTFGTFDRFYYVEDTWENFDRLAVIIDRRYADWRRSKLPFWKRLF